ncbi:MAG: alpha-L-fucosidase [Rikenellaceae bacterium]
MIKRLQLLAIASVALAISSCCNSNEAADQQPFTAEWGSLQKHEAAPDWIVNDKIGFYFHWGVYSVPGWGTEWYPRWMYIHDREGWGYNIYDYHRKTYGENFHYHDFIPQWKGDNFDAKQWVDIFQQAGAKFVGAIAEHHDGFSLWDSEVNEFNSVDMGPKINVVAEIEKEARSRDMKFMATFHHGFNKLFYPKTRSTYKGPITRHTWIYDESGVPTDPKYAKLYSNIPDNEADDLWLAKLDEVVEEYCPDYIWMDFCSEFVSDEHRRKFLCNYFNKGAEMGRDVVVNTKGSYFPTDVAIVNVERATMEDITPSVWITDFIVGSAWSYDQSRRKAMNPEKMVRVVADVVSKNGIVLFSAGPMADGTIPEEQVEAMLEMGKWFNLYGEAIYNTRPFISFGQGPTKLRRDAADEWNIYGGVNNGLYNLGPEDVRYTYDNQRTVYAIQCGWSKTPLTHVLEIFTNKKAVVKEVSMLGTDEKIEWRMTPKGLEVKQPNKMPAEGEAAVVYKITIAQ